MNILLAEHLLGSIVARYVQPCGTKRCELHLIPREKRDDIEEPRAYLDGRIELRGWPDKFKPLVADNAQSLVYLKLRQDDTGPGFSAGITLAESQSMSGLEYSGQEIIRTDAGVTVETTLRDSAGRFRCIHRLRHQTGEPGLRSTVEFINESDSALSLELLSSFALNGLTPFAGSNVTPHLTFHRFRSWWSLEGRVDSMSLEDLHLERSWGGFGQFSNERFGQRGTMPVRQWFPCAAVEDKTAGVVWAAQLAWAGSWQMELFRRGDRVSLCGGLADYEFGHWVKHLSPGERLVTPEALQTVVAGTLDDACHALTTLQKSGALGAPSVERDLPICFNEWCTSWGSPNHENIIAIARRLQGYGVRYIVIDDGWAVRPPDGLYQNNGDWVVDQEKFPGGLKPTCDALRKMGYIPGIWFEFEVINPGAKVWTETSHMLKRDGRPLQVGSRRFWDFNDPWVEDYLTEKVIKLIQDSGIGYLKVDYNDNLGIGCDHPHSLGEGLRQHVEGVQNFFRKLRRKIPDLVIENCASGGHRLEPSMQSLASMGSFSDAHESEIIPMIARNLHRLILPRQSLIWAVLHSYDDNARLIYSLAAAFLGRMCLSGDIHHLSDAQMHILRHATALYKKAAPIIENGRSTFHGEMRENYVDPQGWQAVTRSHGNNILVVAHAFDLPDVRICRLPVPLGNWRIVDSLCDDEGAAQLEGEALSISFGKGSRGGVWILSNQP